MSYFERAFTHGHPIKIGGKVFHVWASYPRHTKAADDAEDARSDGYNARVVKRTNPTRWIVALRRK